MKRIFWEGPLHGDCRDVSAHQMEYYVQVRPPVSVCAFDAHATAQHAEPSPTRHVYRLDSSGDYVYAGLI